MVTYTAGCYRLQSANISYLTQCVWFFKIGYVYTLRKGVGVEHDLTHIAVIILCGDYTGCDEEDDYFATEVDIMTDIVCVR